MNAQKIKKIFSVISNDGFFDGTTIKDYDLYLNKKYINEDYPSIYGINRKNTKGQVLLLAYVNRVNTYLFMGFLSEGYIYKRNMELIPLKIKKINIG